MEDKNEKVIVIFPTINEEKTIKHCIDEVRKSKYNPMIIVSDGNSTDKTREIARESNAIVITQELNIHPGKDAGIVSGIKKALEYDPDVIMVLDADITNLTSEWVDQLIEPIIVEGYDMTRGWYLNEVDVSITRLIVKPLLWTFFPELWHYEQPLSAEVAARRKIWESLIVLDYPKGWGIDIWLLIEANILGCRIKEVFLGRKVHRANIRTIQDIAKLAKISEQVAFTILQEANKYKRLDNISRIAV